MKTILGLDLGTNSIGWTLVNEAENQNERSSTFRVATISASGLGNYSDPASHNAL